LHADEKKDRSGSV